MFLAWLRIAQTLNTTAPKVGQFFCFEQFFLWFSSISSIMVISSSAASSFGGFQCQLGDLDNSHTGWASPGTSVARRPTKVKRDIESLSKVGMPSGQPWCGKGWKRIHHLGFSYNGGTPKWRVYNGKSLRGTPILGNLHLSSGFWGTLFSDEPRCLKVRGISRGACHVHDRI
jgi:hypothetical protein